VYHNSINCDVCVSVCEREQHVVKIASGDKVVLSSFEAHRGPLKIAACAATDDVLTNYRFSTLPSLYVNWFMFYILLLRNRPQIIDAHRMWPHCNVQTSTRKDDTQTISIPEAQSIIRVTGCHFWLI
jgi:hypothetical protein